MPRPILDPTKIENPISDPQPAGALPAACRKFQHVPNIADLMPGDLVLVAPVTWTFQSWAIQKYQNKHFNPSNSQWSHAAVVIGDGRIVEATLDKGVAPGSLYDFSHDHKLLFRRFRGCTDLQRKDIVINACMQIGKQYQISAMTQYFRDYIDRFLPNTYLWDPKTVCSRIYCDALALAMKTILDDVPLDGRATPAHLAASAHFDDVPVRWVKLDDGR